MTSQETNERAAALALSALGWTLQDDGRARRFLDLTGLTPDTLRDAVGTPPIQAGVLRFLESHEPDLIACADDLGTTPGALVAARAELEQ